MTFVTRDVLYIFRRMPAHTTSIKGVDGEMRLHYVLFFLFVSLIVFAGCEEDSAEDGDDVIEIGDIQGTVANKETGEPIENATVDIGGNTALTDSEGRYVLEGLSFSSEMDVLVNNRL